MTELLVIAAQPNPPGRDVTRPGSTTNELLNQEWIEIAAQATRSVIGDELFHETFTAGCLRTGVDALLRFPVGQLIARQRVRVCTGHGAPHWLGNTWYLYLNRDWFVWNNACGDRATLAYRGTILDSARYGPHPPEGVLHRVAGTDRLEPASNTVNRVFV